MRLLGWTLIPVWLGPYKNETSGHRDMYGEKMMWRQLKEKMTIYKPKEKDQEQIFPSGSSEGINDGYTLVLDF